MAALDRMDNWNEYDEAKIRRLLGVDQKKASVSGGKFAHCGALSGPPARHLSRPGEGVFGQDQAALMTSGQN